jgi:hypothetical protein
MVAIIISLVLLAVLILIAIHLASLKKPAEAESDTSLGTTGPLIHASGIYSIVRKSPRDDLQNIRPKEAELRKYCAAINEDINKSKLNESDKQKLMAMWQKAMDENIKVVEQGDCEDVSFYYLDFPRDNQCPVCATYVKRGQFVTREEIFSNPAIIPPFHLGCTTKIVPYHGKEDLRDTAIIGMAPLFKGHTPPVFPEWKKTVKITS